MGCTVHPPSQLTSVTTHDLKSRNGKINSLRPSDIYALINKVITSSDNGLSLVPQQPIAWTNAAAGINLSKIWIKKKIIKNYMKMLYAKYIPLCLGLYVLHMTTHHDNAGKNNPEETKRQSSMPVKWAWRIWVKSVCTEPQQNMSIIYGVYCASSFTINNSNNTWFKKS